MRKFVALLLALMLAMGVMITSASAYTDYSLTTLKAAYYGASQLTSTDDTRVATAALVYIDYVLADGAHMNEISLTGYSYIAQYGSLVDIYFLTSSGQYLNLCLSPSISASYPGKITDYGVGGKPTNTTYTYRLISNEAIFEKILEALGD